MRHLRHIQITRRVALIGASASAVAVIAPITSAAETVSEVPSDRSPLSDNLISKSSATYFDPEWKSQFEAHFPTRVTLEAPAANLRMSVLWDDRLFDVGDLAFSVTGPDLKAVPLELAEGGFANLAIPDGALEIFFRVTPIELYPNENLEDVKLSQLQIVSADGVATRTWADTPMQSACAPWGIEGSVSWVSHKGQIVPALTSLVSVGPHPAPAGLITTITHSDIVEAPVMLVQHRGELTVADPPIADSAELDTGDAEPTDSAEEVPVVTVSSTVKDGLRTVSITTSRPLEPTERVDVVNAIQSSDSTPSTFGVSVPRMYINSPLDVAGMRKTGRESSYPVTGAGSQESSYVAVPGA